MLNDIATEEHPGEVPTVPMIRKLSQNALNGEGFKKLAPIPRSPKSNIPPPETPTAEGEPTLEEIQRILPPEILRALNREGTLGTHRCSVKHRGPGRPSPIVTPTNSSGKKTTVDGVRDLLKGIS